MDYKLQVCYHAPFLSFFAVFFTTQHPLSAAELLLFNGFSLSAFDHTETKCEKNAIGRLCVWTQNCAVCCFESSAFLGLQR
jgi:hypothetical protein